MIREQKGGPFGWVLDQYITRKFRSAFRGLWVRGTLPTGDAGRLVYLNHCNWWDGFMLHQLSRAADWDAYCLMEEENLQRYRFLARIGAFSIRRKDAVSSVESLRYAKELLRRPRAALYVFPEGEHRPFGVFPLKLERGVELLAKVSKVECVPIGVRYAFFEHERPDVLLEVGTPHPPGPMSLFQDGLEAVVQRVAAATSLDGFTRKVAGARGVAERWDSARGLAP
ncbi:lysophospholipid acyltransferase family protein [Pyxidicoccus parkwayensis]|uniref:Lysophospholipid acyltransferase family protein n=1 Tax=Pyxidicoccus parkwayensis TaxID=2813578 RepID=A0ABX7NNF0_9BACT|nr:lysophospholipid acyltransferase family protein [Pyxidicoccus parkwaysis]QSQ20367.1 lysophospholipid acyltransferase family protein [Pyxidicoccus parkwaysis]